MRIIETAFDAAIAKIPGQAALAAVAMSGVSAAGEPVSNVVIDQSLRAAGLNHLRKRIEFESAWRARFETFAPATPAPSNAEAASSETPPTEEEGLTPRVKPRRSG